jgi:LysM repeat protein
MQPTQPIQTTHSIMKHTHLAATAAATIALTSCASQKADTYDTGDAYGYADSGMAGAQAPAYDNPVYDTPAAYEESHSTAAAHSPPATPIPTVAPSPPAASANQSAIIHTVVKGDTLSGLSSKYKVPMQSIMRANNMTTDTVVLGRKMAIPPN